MRGTLKGCIVNVIVVIDGREAIPVRAIPLLTDWDTMGPDSVALAFAWDEHIYRSEGFNAYRIENNIAKSIEARWWKNVLCVQFDALHHELKRQETSGILSEQEGLRQWRIASLPLLPEGVFVWKDEFEPLYVIRYGVDGLTDLWDKTADGAMPEDEQLRKVKLDYDPFIAELKTQRLVMEGFMPPEMAPDHNSPKTNVPPATDTAPEQNTATPASVEAVAKPWLKVDPRDPNPKQDWYTPARYFARQLVIADTTLLTKKLILADKVSSSLVGVGIFKRGGKKPHAPDTVLKAFANVTWG